MQGIDLARYTVNHFAAGNKCFGKVLFCICSVALGWACMRLRKGLIIFVIGAILPMTAVVEAQDSVRQITPQNDSRSNARPKSALIADCPETTFMPSPLARRPVLHRATHASRPARPHRHRKATPRKKPVVHRKHRAVRHLAHKRHPAPHRRAAHPTRARLHKVTYASPLCGERSQTINDLIGLPDVTELPVAAAATDVPTQVFDLPAIVGAGGTTGPTGPGVGFPTGPGFPGGPTGPIVPLPPVVPPTPPTPPIPPVAVPEPASWATMMLGMALVGRSMRRRRPSTRSAAR